MLLFHSWISDSSFRLFFTVCTDLIEIEFHLLFSLLMASEILPSSENISTLCKTNVVSNDENMPVAQHVLVDRHLNSQSQKY